MGGGEGCAQGSKEGGTHFLPRSRRQTVHGFEFTKKEPTSVRSFLKEVKTRPPPY